MPFQLVTVAVLSSVISSWLALRWSESISSEALGVLQEDILRNGDAISRIEGLLSQKSMHEAPAGPRVSEDVGSNVSRLIMDHNERLSVLEEQLEKFAIEVVASARPERGDLAERFSGPVLVTTASDYQLTHEMEDKFATASGSDDHGYAESIFEAFEYTELDVTLGDVYCKASMCRISYTEEWAPDSTMTKSGSSSLLDQIAENLPGEDLDVRFVRDGGGNTTMYLEVQ